MGFRSIWTRRLLAPALVAAVALASACADQQPNSPNDTMAPETAVVPGTGAMGNAVCPTQTQLTSLLQQLFPSGKSYTGAKGKLDSAYVKLSQNKLADAQKKAYDLINVTLQSYYAGKLIGGTSTATQSLVNQLIAGLGCAFSLPTAPVDLSPGTAVGVFTPGQQLILRTGDKLAGAVLPPNAANVPLIVSIDPLPAPGGGAGPLNTDLDQYPLFYEYSTQPVVTFNVNVSVSICTVGLANLDVSTFKIAHNIGPNIGDVELLPTSNSNPASLDCTAVATQNPALYQTSMAPTSELGRLLFAGLDGVKHTLTPIVSALLPQSLSASATMGTCCLTGATKTFSPFGAVDPNSDTVSATGGITSFTAPANTAVAPSVTIVKKATAVFNAGGPVRGEWVKFAVTSGGGSVTPDSARTNSSGVAAASWTINAGANGLTASATNGQDGPVAGDTRVPVPGSPITFTATGTTGFDYGAANWSYDIFQSLTDAEAARTGTLSKTGTAAFASVETSNCALNLQSGVRQTDWPIASADAFSFLVAKHTFSVSTTGATITLSIDNDVRVWVDAQEVTSTAVRSLTNNTSSVLFGPAGSSVSSGSSSTYAAGNYLIHDACPVRDDYSFTATGLTGAAHTVTIIGLDRGGSTFFDAKVTEPPVIY